MTDAAFIEPGCLAGLQGRCLFYPVAGFDWSEFLLRFGDHIDEFHFCDITYNLSTLRSPFANPSSYRLIEKDIQGKPAAQIQYPTAERPYRMLEPARLKEVYDLVGDGRRITVIRKRGFGQYALAEFPERSIGTFVHRGDSPGEGGSNVYFLGNQLRRHEPLSNLFDKLTNKLADRALIVSDGSNTCFGFLKKVLRKAISCADAYDRLRERKIDRGAFSWRCVGFIGSRNGRTLVWQVTRQ